MSDWRLTQLTHGSADGLYHAHSYYDVPVFDGTGQRVIAHRLPFEGRAPTAEDEITVGLIDADRPESFEPIGTSRAWSWQQGPMAQWVAGGPHVVWNDRAGGRLVARLHDTERGETRTLPRTVYGLDPAGRFALSLDMARLDRVRPGYGYPAAAETDPRRRSRDDGVWRFDLPGGEPRLILSLDRAVSHLYDNLGLLKRADHLIRQYVYWFNHAKVSPNGRRFTVKLRWRQPGGPWNDRMGVSLTCGTDGEDLRLLSPAASHVIWRDDRHLFFWRNDAVRLIEDALPQPRLVGEIAPQLTRQNVHMRELAPDSDLFVLDTPYREEIELLLYDRSRDTHSTMARFTGHRPARGPFRCDLHPCPDPTGQRIVVTSVQDGGRQVYLLDRS